MRYGVSLFATILILLLFKTARAIDWMDYDQSSSDIDMFYADDADQYLSALIRADELEIHSPIMTGNKYVSGMRRSNVPDTFVERVFQVEQARVNSI